MEALNYGGGTPSQEEARRLLAGFGFAAAQKREVWEAFKTSPDGVERCAERAKAQGQREGRTGAGLLLTMIRAGEHLLEPDPNTRRITGWRWATGQGHAAGTYVEDPTGTDPLPPGYDLTTRSTVGDTPREPEPEPAPLTDEIRAELHRLAGRRPEQQDA